ncbi:MAG: NUDIX hydrolase [Gammaproteobacteria bacterium]|nr:NUDIX hydrolase [Gammaproteobacteria bacterium]MDH5691918.1 NUDIX hydrolase [Gammaproteobacteria bacterium]
MRWSPRVTVATILEKDNKFLMVEEIIKGKTFFNQPAGHWENNESLEEAAVRETLEETAWSFKPTELVGIYRWTHPELDDTYLRFTFTGVIGEYFPDRELDEGIVNAHWMSYNEIEACMDQHRSPQVLLCIQDYIQGKRYSLDCIRNI